MWLRAGCLNSPHAFNDEYLFFSSSFVMIFLFFRLFGCFTYYGKEKLIHQSDYSKSSTRLCTFKVKILIDFICGSFDRINIVTCAYIV